MPETIRNFNAIDFETANENPSSVCSVGIVFVRDGEIVVRYGEDETGQLLQPHQSGTGLLPVVLPEGARTRSGRHL